MSDDLDMTAAESAETAQGAATDDAPASTEAPPPWGEDFNPERAWNTISHLRGVEKELEPDAKAYKRLQSGEDPDTFRQIAEAYGYEIADEEPEDDDISDAGQALNDPRLDELVRWKEEREAAEAIKAFDDHLNKLATDAEFELSERERKWIARESVQNGFTQEATEAAFQEVREAFEERERRAIERYTNSKKAPHVAASGKEAKPGIDLDDEQARQRWMAEQVAARQQQL